MNDRNFSQMYRTTILSVDSYDNGVLNGRFYHPYNESGCKFHSMTQFLSEMERVLNEMAFPQSFNSVRSFTQASPTGKLPIFTEQLMTGKLATFSICVLFRQNASWQGSIRWIEGEREESFRSVLELIFLMDSALSAPSEQQAG